MSHTAKIIILATICLILAFGLGAVGFKEFDKEYDCDDFKTHKGVVEFFLKDVTDPYRLDADHDGIPCESYVY